MLANDLLFTKFTKVFPTRILCYTVYTHNNFCMYVLISSLAQIFIIFVATVHILDYKQSILTINIVRYLTMYKLYTVGPVNF